MTTNEGFARVRAEDKVNNGAEPDYTALVDGLRKEFDSGKTKDLAWRRRQLQQVLALIEDSHEQITAAVRQDHGGAKLRGLAELGAHAAATMALDNLDKWAADEVVATPMQTSPSRLGKSFIRREPKGVVLIIAPWNFPVELALHPLVAAIASGNCVVIKPSEVSANSAALIERLVNKYMDTSCIKIVQGAVAETTALLKQRWDHIFYTGNGHVGRIICRAAAEHLTPVTLELGGKSPVVIDKSAKMESVISRVSMSKWLNAGQICVAPDYVLVHKDREEEFVKGMKQQITKSFGADPKKSADFGRVINPNHVKRINALVEQTKGQVVVGGQDSVDASAKYYPPTLVRNAKEGEPLMKEEIFGPVLPIIPVDNMQEAVKKVNGVCDRPLALYVFAEDKQAIKTVMDGTLSGGVAVNTTLEHLGNAHLPFGGVGASGYGAYHGKFGFDEFSHKRSFLHQDTTLIKGPGIPPPPYKDSLYDIAVKATVTGFFTPAQRRVAKFGVAAAGAAVAGMVVSRM